MLRTLLMSLSAAALLATASVAPAAPCRDAKGKFMKCPTKPAPPKRCRDAKGHFAKCPK
ncbi:MAG: hypothetical protein JWO25_2840 [Alphaproteobacteria bacterium]|nr:hypothetical protein [Alphaproteobacteria bacterium]MDB5722107.1 hypothetical protein [Alphaproteobacteria bacterium]